MSFQLHSMIRGSHTKKDYVIPQKHDAFEIVYYIGGRGTTTINGETFEFHDNSIAVIAPGSVHDESTFEACEVLFCIFETDEALPFNNKVIQNDNGQCLPVLKLLEQIEKELFSQKFNFLKMISSYIGQIVILLQRTMPNTEEKAEVAEYARRVLKQNYASKINFAELAYSVGYSYDRFRHIFRIETDETLMQYLIGIRMVHAKEYLKNTGYDIEYIGKSCGYKSVSNFINTFKEKVGVTPYQYRSKLQLAKSDVLNFSASKKFREE